jgi:thiamine biosynthesis lipoprotein
MSTTFTFEAIGTHFWIEIFDEISETKLKAAQGRLELLSSTFNEQYSRFRPDSQISILNRERVLLNPSEECRTLLTYGKELYLKSEATFNFLTGHLQEAQGYDATYSFTPNESIKKTICNPLTDIDISKEKITLHCGNVDLGGYGKGWLIDKLKDDLLKHDIKHFLINGGGDMYATSTASDEAISVYLEHPTEAGKYLAETNIRNQGFAASSPFKRQWKHGDSTYSHIISEADVLKLATFVKAPTATLADVFGTVSLLVTEEKLLAITEREGFAFARYNPETNQLWQTTNFS